MSPAERTQLGGASWRVRPLGYAVMLVGSLLALISLAGTSWYTVSGPNVVFDDSQAGPVNGGDVILVSRDIGSQHSWLVWALFVVCVVTAVLAGLPAAGRQLMAMRVIAPTLAVFLILGAIARVVIPRLVVGHVEGLGLPAGTHVTIGAGFWLAVLGFAMIAVGAVVGPVGPAITPPNQCIRTLSESPLVCAQTPPWPS